MVARHPDDSLEPLAEHAKRELQVRRPFADIASKDQPVLRVLANPFQRVAVRRVPKVQVADCEEPHPAVNPRLVLEGSWRDVASNAPTHHVKSSDFRYEDGQP